MLKRFQLGKRVPKPKKTAYALWFLREPLSLRRFSEAFLVLLKDPMWIISGACRVLEKNQKKFEINDKKYIWKNCLICR
jgi:hypothetical protein